MKRMSPQRELAARVAAAGSQKQVAVDLEISQAYLCDLLAGRRSFSKAILTKLGMETVIVRSQERKSA